MSLDQIQNEELRALVVALGRHRPLVLKVPFCSDPVVETIFEGWVDVQWEGVNGAVGRHDAPIGVDLEITAFEDGEWHIELYSYENGAGVDLPFTPIYNTTPPINDVVYAWDEFCRLAGVAQEGVEL